jgi:hypothetical protein
MKNTENKKTKNTLRRGLFVLGIIFIDVALLLLGRGTGLIIAQKQCEVLIISGGIAALVDGIICLKTYRRLSAYDRDEL